MAHALQVQPELKFSTQYIFRGQKQAAASCQPAVSISHILNKGWLFAQLGGNFPVHSSHRLKGRVVQFQGGCGRFLDEFLFKDSFNIIAGSLFYNFYHYPQGPGYEVHELGASVSAQVPYRPTAALYYNFTEKQVVSEFSIEEVFFLTNYVPAVFENEDWKIRCGALVGFSSAHKPLAGPKNNYAYFTLRSALEYAPLEALTVCVGLEGALQGASSFPQTALAVDGGIKFLF